MHLIILLILLILIINLYFPKYKKISYKKFEYNIKDVKKLPHGFEQLPYYKSELSDIDNIDKNKCLKKCNNINNCAGIFIWEFDNYLSSCNMIYKNKNKSPIDLIDFYKNNKNSNIMDNWKNGYTYIKKK
jgi:hypothetical protein